MEQGNHMCLKADALLLCQVGVLLPVLSLRVVDPFQFLKVIRLGVHQELENFFKSLFLFRRTSGTGCLQGVRQFVCEHTTTQSKTSETDKTVTILSVTRICYAIEIFMHSIHSRLIHGTRSAENSNSIFFEFNCKGFLPFLNYVHIKYGSMEL